MIKIDSKIESEEMKMEDIQKKMFDGAFPGGYKQLAAETKEVSELLNGEYSLDKIEDVLLHITFLYGISEDNSVERIIGSINIKTDGKFIDDDIIKIYNYVENKFSNQSNSTEQKNDLNKELLQCTACKKEIESDSKFCEFCGIKIETKSCKGMTGEDLSNYKTSQKTDAEIGEVIVNNKNAQLQQLSEKMWYRVVKVIYFLSIFIAISTSIILSVGHEDIWYFVVFSISTVIVAEILKRSFYYIMFGTLQPNK